jgi:hypothetical protein
VAISVGLRFGEGVPSRWRPMGRDDRRGVLGILRWERFGGAGATGSVDVP